MPSTFADFTLGTTAGGATPIQTNDFVVGYDTSVLNGERRWPITTLARSVSSIMSEEIINKIDQGIGSGGSIVFQTEKNASGTSVDFTGIPSWAKRITLILNEVSSNSSSDMLFRIGPSSGFVLTGYSSYCNSFNSNPSGTTTTAGFLINESTASNSTVFGSFHLIKISGNTWITSGGISDIGDPAQSVFGGGITLTGNLERVRFTTVNGTSLFDNGTINIAYE